MRNVGAKARLVAAVAGMLVLVVAATACVAPAPLGSVWNPSPASSAPGDRAALAEVAATADRCDPMGGPRCLLPFPNDHFTVSDDGTDTGRRVHLAQESMPANKDGVHIDPAEWNRNDGFSPGSAITLLIPGIDLARTGAAPITDMGSSLDDDSAVVILDAETGERHPHWAELDSLAPDDAHRLLFVRPARNLLEGHRYIVAIRHVRDAAGSPIEAPVAFRAYRDRNGTGIPALEHRRGHMEQIFQTLRKAGVPRDDLYLAWDFTVASGRNLSERLLAMRDDAFGDLGSAAPAFTVDSVTPSTRANLRSEVRGTFQVPLYLTGTGAPGSVLNNGSGPGADPIPERNGTYTASYVCTLSTSTVAGGTAVPGRPIVYGHGLLGSATEVLGSGSRFSATGPLVACATWEIGMASEDVPTAAAAVQELTRFRAMADRLQQGLLNELFLGRLLKHPDGFASNPAFQAPDGTPVIDHDELAYVGLSQGGILGGAVSAVAQDWTRSFLGVPAMNYSTLLDRSVDFDPFASIVNPAYPDFVERQLGVLLIQMLWDRGEGNGYAEHITSDPYRGTPAKQVLMFEAFGDHQVANVATEVEARTIGALLRAPGLAAGRSPDVVPFWGIDAVDSADLPHEGGSYLVVWDFGTPPPPTGNLPNRAGEDPHGKGRDDPAVLSMVIEFLADGRLIDVCGAGLPCQTLPGP